MHTRLIVTLALTPPLCLGEEGGKPLAASFIDTMGKPPPPIVDGRPHLIFGAQCDIWRSTRQDAQTVAFFDEYRAMHASTVSVGIP